MNIRWLILAYHGIANEYAEQFAAQLDGLRSAGWTFCSLTEGHTALRNGTPARLATVTFDDGDRTVAQVARPLLDQRGIRAALYATTDYMARGTVYRDTVSAPAMTWSDVREWVTAGHELGGHTHTHVPLTKCEDLRVHEELERCHGDIAREAGVSIRHLSYPWGQQDTRVRRLVAAHGTFETAATIDRGDNRPGVDPLRLKRDLVSPAWSFAQLKRRLQLSRIPGVYRMKRWLIHRRLDAGDHAERHYAQPETK